jgi:hypothetical protein
VLFQLLQLCLKVAYTLADMSLIGLKLGLAGTSCADTAAQSGKRRARTRKAGETVFLLSQLDLQLALLCPCALSEDVQYQGGPVDDADVQYLLDISHLDSRKLMVEYDQLSLKGFQLLLQLLKPACAHAGGRVIGGTLLYDSSHHFGVCRISQLRQLVYRDLRIEFSRVHAGEDGFYGKVFRFVFVHSDSLSDRLTAVELRHIAAEKLRKNAVVSNERQLLRL